MVILSVLNIVILLWLFLKEKHDSHGNIFSAASIFIYFASLPALSNLYFSIDQESFHEIVLSQVAILYRDNFFVNVALFMTIIGNLVTFFGISYGSTSNNKLFNDVMNKILFTRYFIANKLNRVNAIFRFGVIIYILGFIVYLIFLQKMGGLSQIWEELYLRSTKNAGLGYYQTFYMIAIQLGAMIILWYAFIKNKLAIKIIVFIITIIILGSVGSRGPIIIFLITMMIMYHYLIRRIHKLLNFKTVILLFLIPVFIVAMLQFRSHSYDYLMNNKDELIENSIKSFESGFIARIGRLERDIVILKYFSNNDFWWGKSYYGLIYAPIPRSVFPEKPPVDTGMYLRTMALGLTVEPPMAVGSLNNSSWPEWNWVGYMNWGLPGFIFFFFMSGLFFGKFYQYIKKYRFPILPTCLFAIIAVGGPPIFSPPGLVNLITLFIIIYILIRLVYLPFKN